MVISLFLNVRKGVSNICFQSYLHSLCLARWPIYGLNILRFFLNESYFLKFLFPLNPHALINLTDKTKVDETPTKNTVDATSTNTVEATTTSASDATTKGVKRVAEDSGSGDVYIGDWKRMCVAFDHLEVFNNYFVVILLF